VGAKLHKDEPDSAINVEIHKDEPVGQATTLHFKENIQFFI
jgi:hypothetical protein